LCREITRARARNMCEDIQPVCGCWGTDTAHVLSKKTWPSVRYDPANLLYLCREDHDYYRSARLVGPSPMRELYIELRGRDAWKSLVAKASQKARPIAETVKELRTMAAQMGIK